MTEWRPGGLQTRHPRADDHAHGLAVLDDWWGGFGGEAGSRERALLLPRLFFQHSTDTSQLVERADGRLDAFLIGFVSASRPGTAHVHFVGVDPACADPDSVRARTGSSSGGSPNEACAP